MESSPLFFLVLLYTLSVFPGPSTCDGKDDDDDRPRLVLAPANATVSPGVGVTLGCAASTAVRACQWSFYPEKDPDRRHDLAPFSPLSKHSRRSRGDSDCSVDIKRVNSKHSGYWVCTVLPLNHGRLHIVSKAAFLKVLRPNKPPITPFTTTTEEATTSYEIVTTTSTTTTTTTTTTAKPSPSPRPRALLPPPTRPTSSASALDPAPVFVIDRGRDGSVSVTWVMEALGPGWLRRCIWITPGKRARLVGDSPSGSVWVDRGNSSCGVRVGPDPMAADPMADGGSGEATQYHHLTGDWSVVAEYNDGLVDRKLTATIAVDPRPPFYAVVTTTTTTTTTGATTESPVSILGVEVKGASPLAVIVGMSVGCGFVVLCCFAAAACCCKRCCCSKKEDKEDEKSESGSVRNNNSQSPSPRSPLRSTSIVGISARAPLVKTLVRNPEYAPVVAVSSNIQERRLPVPASSPMVPPSPTYEQQQQQQQHYQDLAIQQQQYQDLVLQQQQQQQPSVQYADMAPAYQDVTAAAPPPPPSSAGIYARANYRRGLRPQQARVVSPSPAHRHSIIGIEAPVPMEEEAAIDVGSPPVDPNTGAPHYSYILPKTQHPPPPNYLTMVPPRQQQKQQGRRQLPRTKFDDYYEHVARPPPPYENNMEFTTFGFSSLQRQAKQRRSDGSNSSSTNSSNSNTAANEAGSEGGDSGLGMEQQPQQQQQQQQQVVVRQLQRPQELEVRQLAQLLPPPQMPRNQPQPPSLEPPSMEIEMPPPMKEIKSILKRNY